MLPTREQLFARAVKESGLTQFGSKAGAPAAIRKAVGIVTGVKACCDGSSLGLVRTGVAVQLRTSFPSKSRAP